MKLKNLLPVAFTGLLALSSCDQISQKRAKEVKDIMTLLQPTELVYNTSVNYIGGRRDISLTQEQAGYLIDTHAKLSMVPSELESGKISIERLLLILQGPESIITTPQATKLKIVTNFGEMSSLSCLKDGTLVLSGGQHSPDTHLSACTATAEMQGGELKIIISGNKSIAKAGSDKGQMSASIETVSTGKEETLMITIGTVLVEPKNTPRSLVK